jgi:hypothetical protein
LKSDERPTITDERIRSRAHAVHPSAALYEVGTRNSDAPTLTVFGVRVTRKVGPFILKREYAAPDV